MKNTPSKNLFAIFHQSLRTFCEREAAEKSSGNQLRLSAKSQEQKMTEVIWGIWSHWQKLDQFWKSQKERRFGKFPYKVIQLPTLQPSTVSNTQRNHTAKCHSSYQPLGGLNIHWFVDRENHTKSHQASFGKDLKDHRMPATEIFTIPCWAFQPLFCANVSHTIQYPKWRHWLIYLNKKEKWTKFALASDRIFVGRWYTWKLLCPQQKSSNHPSAPSWSTVPLRIFDTSQISKLTRNNV